MLKKISIILIFLLAIIMSSSIIMNFISGTKDTIEIVKQLSILIQSLTLLLVILNFIYTHLDASNIIIIEKNWKTDAKKIPLKLWNLGKNIAIFDCVRTMSIECFSTEADNKETENATIAVLPQSKIEFKIILKDESKGLDKIVCQYFDNLGSHSLIIKRDN
ncbi:MAG: hypothetical protein HQK91_11620 [Nitrospirae bacterium]|nr:hypothetical protein [Nitrospirota bacterium]